MLRRIFKSLRFFLPRQVDVSLILLALLLLAAIAVPETFRFQNFAHGFQPSHDTWLPFLPFLSVTVIIAISFGTYSIARQRQQWRFITAAFFLSLLLLPYLLWREHLFLFRPGEVNVPVSEPDFAIQWFATMALCLIGWLSARLIVFAMTRLKGRFINLHWNRKKMLVGLAIALFALHLMSKFVDISGVSASLRNGIGSPIVSGVLGSIVITFAAILLVAPIVVFHRSRRWNPVVIAICYVLVGVGAILVLNDFFKNELVPGLICWFVSFVIVAPLVKQQFGFSETNTLEQKGSTVLDRSRPRRPIWGTGLLLIVMALAAVFSVFDLATLVLCRNNRFSLAREAKTLSTEPTARPRIMVSEYPGGVYLWGDIVVSQQTAANFFRRLSSPAFAAAHLNLSGVSPETDVSLFQPANQPVLHFSDSTMSRSQLQTMTRNGVSYVGFSNCRFVEAGKQPTDVVRLGPTSAIVFWDTEPGEVANFLDLIDPQSSIGQINIRANKGLSGSDWASILRASQCIQITVADAPPPGHVIESLSNDGQERLLRLDAIDALTPGFWKLLLDTKIQTYVTDYGIATNQQSIYDAIFASESAGWSRLTAEQANFNPETEQRVTDDFLATATDYHWIFERHEDSTPKGILIPFGASQFIREVSQLTSLETLSFEARWLPAFADYFDLEMPAGNDVRRLGNLTQLKRLDFPEGIWLINLSFLGQLPSLEHLQIDVYQADRLGFDGDPAKMTSLKSLVLFGRPTKAFAIEIGKLPALERLKIVDISSELSTENQVNQLREAIGQEIDLEIVAVEEFRPEVPAEFTQHLRRVRTLVRERYLGSE
jgi:hypothetical protein